MSKNTINVHVGALLLMIIFGIISIFNREYRNLFLLSGGVSWLVLMYTYILIMGDLKNK